MNIERIAIEVIAGLCLVWGTVMYLEHRGAAQCRAADAAAITKQEAHNEAQATLDTQIINQEAQAHAQALSADPLPTPALNCVRIAPRALPQAPTAQPVRHDPADGGKADRPAVGDDPGPDLGRIGKAADAQIVELQSYIHDVCLR